MQARGRPRKYKVVRTNPKISQFSPRGRPGRPEEVNLKVEEFESIRLTDYIGLNQKAAAQSMHISQQTLSRILKKARKTIANALINGRIIKIQGGTYVMTSKDSLPIA